MISVGKLCNADGNMMFVPRIIVDTAEGCDIFNSASNVQMEWMCELCLRISQLVKIQSHLILFSTSNDLFSFTFIKTFAI